jgi:hypothetical protein
MPKAKRMLASRCEREPFTEIDIGKRISTSLPRTGQRSQRHDLYDEQEQKKTTNHFSCPPTTHGVSVEPLDLDTHFY